jgi:hypothetical protein
MVLPARPRTRATIGVLAVAACGLMSLGTAASAHSATDHMYATLGQTSVTGPIPDAGGGGGTHDDAVGGGGVHENGAGGGGVHETSSLGGVANASAGLGSSPDCGGGGGIGEL